jgi:hypothetical protein
LKDPVGAVAEMVWNALDAEALNIAVEVETNELDGVEFVCIPKSPQSRRTTLRLLKEIIAIDPGGLFPVLDELFRLPQSEQEELKRLLQRTSLSEVIKATSQVTARLDFLAALKLLVFEPDQQDGQGAKRTTQDP